MATKMSTGFRTRILGPDSFNGLMGGGVIRVFSGSPPADADHSEVGTLLGLVTVDGMAWSADTPGPAGLQWTQLGALMVSPQTAAWRLTCATAGAAGWFRIVGPWADSGGASITLPRIDGVIGTTDSPGDMTWGSTDLVAGASYSISNVFFALPPLF